MDSTAVIALLNSWLNYLQHNWFTLAVAVVGAAPGWIAWKDERRNRVIFTYSLGGMISGQTGSKMSPPFATCILLTGTASNKGKFPLSPAYFLLDVKLDGKWYGFEKYLIPEGAKFAMSSGQTSELDSATKRDLQRFEGAITQGMPTYGSLLFINTEVPLDLVRKNQSNGKIGLRLKCVDIFEDTHVVNITLDLRDAPGLILPKHGISSKKDG